MRVVLFQGSFDVLNAGHIRALKRAKSLGDYLIVALNTDELYRQYKGHGTINPVIPYRQRKEMLEGIKWVDEVIPANDASPMGLLQKYDVDVYVLTREWENYHQPEMEYMRAKNGLVDFSPRYPDIMCSSDIRARIIEREEEIKSLRTKKE